MATQGRCDDDDDDDDDGDDDDVEDDDPERRNQLFIRTNRHGDVFSAVEFRLCDLSEHGTPNSAQKWPDLAVALSKSPNLLRGANQYAGGETWVPAAEAWPPATLLRRSVKLELDHRLAPSIGCEHRLPRWRLMRKQRRDFICVFVGELAAQRISVPTQVDLPLQACSFLDRMDKLADASEYCSLSLLR